MSRQKPAHLRGLKLFHLQFQLLDTKQSPGGHTCTPDKTPQTYSQPGPLHFSSPPKHFALPHFKSYNFRSTKRSLTSGTEQKPQPRCACQAASGAAALSRRRKRLAPIPCRTPFSMLFHRSHLQEPCITTQPPRGPCALGRPRASPSPGSRGQSAGLSCSSWLPQPLARLCHVNRRLCGSSTRTSSSSPLLRGVTLAESTPQQAASGAEHIHLHCRLHRLGRCWSQHPPHSLPFVPVCGAPARVRELPPEGTDRKPRASSSQQGSLPPAYLTPAQRDKLRLCPLCAAPGKEYTITPRLSRLEANQTDRAPLHLFPHFVKQEGRPQHISSPKKAANSFSR